jgi:hypothetical protein
LYTSCVSGFLTGVWAKHNAPCIIKINAKKSMFLFIGWIVVAKFECKINEILKSEPCKSAKSGIHPFKGLNPDDWSG